MQVASLDEGCGSAKPNSTSSFALCESKSAPEDGDWAGAFLVADIAGCEPTATNGCMMPDSITGTCSCPADATETDLRVFVPGTLGAACVNSYLGAKLGVCLRSNPQITSVSGVYQRDDDGHCRAFSSGLTGCTCPSGTLISSLRSIAEKAGTTTFAPVSTTISFCLATPMP
jgi:hypothetical protein